MNSSSSVSKMQRLNAESRRRLEEIDKRIEELNKVINNIKGSERFYFQTKMLGVKLKKQKLMSVSVYAQSEQTRLLLAEVDVMTAEYDLNVEIEAIRSCKKFRRTERSLERKERRRRQEDIEATILEAAASQDTRTTEPFTVRTQLFKIPIHFATPNLPTDIATTSNNCERNTQGDPNSSHNPEEQNNLEEDPNSCDAGDSQTASMEDEISADEDLSDKDNGIASPTPLTDEEALDTNPEEPTQEKSETHNSIKTLFRTYKQIYISVNGEMSQIAPSPRTASLGGSPERESPASPTADSAGCSPKAGSVEDSPNTEHHSDSPTFTNSDGESNSSKEYELIENAAQVTSSTSKRQNGCSDETQNCPMNGKNNENSSNSSTKHRIESSPKQTEKELSTTQSKTQNLENLFENYNIFQITNSQKRSMKRPRSDDSSSQKTEDSSKNIPSTKKPKKPHHATSKETESKEFANHISSGEEAVQYMTELVKLRCAVDSPKRVQELKRKAMETDPIPSTSQEIIVNELFKDLMASKRVEQEANCSSDIAGSLHKCGTVSEGHMCVHTLKHFLE